MILIEALVMLWNFFVNGCDKETGETVEDDNDSNRSSYHLGGCSLVCRSPFVRNLATSGDCEDYEKNGGRTHDRPK